MRNVKKAVVGLLAAALVLSSNATAFAASMETDNTVPVEAATDGVEVSAIDQDEYDDPAVEAALAGDVEAFADESGMDVADDAEIVAAFNAREIGNVLPAWVVFSVAGIEAGDKAQGYHFDGVEWEAVDTRVNDDGDVELYLTSLSPIVIVKIADGGSDAADDAATTETSADTTGSNAGKTQGGATSPKTGVESMYMIYGAAALVCAVAASRKKRA